MVVWCYSTHYCKQSRRTMPYLVIVSYGRLLNDKKHITIFRNWLSASADDNHHFQNYIQPGITYYIVHGTHILDFIHNVQHLNSASLEMKQ